MTSVVTDPQGSVVGTVHNTDWASGVSRKRPDPFGGARSSGSVTSQGRGFLGAVHDSNALVLLGARFFDPAAGVFVSVDPLLDPGNPAQFNAYVYAGNNPVTWSDPSGLAWTGPVADGGDHRYTWKGKTGTGKTKTKPGASSSATGAGVGTQPAGAGYPFSQYQAPSCGATWSPCTNAGMPEPEWAAEIRITVALSLIPIPVVGAAAGAIRALSVAAKYVPKIGSIGVKGAKVGDDIVGVTAAATKPTIHWGQQSKHFPGHPNFIRGRSELTADPRRLLEHAGTGAPANAVVRGAPGFKERVDFGAQIGNYVKRDGVSEPTSVGIIHYRADGSVHIVPGAPR